VFDIKLNFNIRYLFNIILRTFQCKLFFSCTQIDKNDVLLYMDHYYAFALNITTDRVTCEFMSLLVIIRDAVVLKHCATSRKVAGSILDGIIGIFHRHVPFRPWV
jgi:hypothetical protein